MVWLIAAIGAPAGAQQSHRLAVRGHAIWLSPAGDETPVATDLVTERATNRLDESGSGFSLGLEYRLRPRLGLELDVFVADLDTDLLVAGGGTTLADTEKMGLESVSLGASWYLLSRERLEVAAGLFVAQTTFDDVVFLTEAGRSEKHTFDDDHGFGVKIAVGLPFRRGSSWSARAEIRYLVTILESEIAGQDLDLDPLVLAFGCAYRF